ncbi:MAG TPA: cupin domain-containing protein [Gemmatimonadales bacterium]|jgi:UDP-2-acetamido-2,6-beta-L-arabino-hexul-4-ose reductase
MSAVASFQLLAVKSDDRGYVFEPAGADDLPGQRNVHVVMTRPGAVRGNHVHARGTEILTVVGPALIRVRESGALRDVQVAPGAVMRCLFPPGVAHAVRNDGDEPQILVAFNTVEHDPAAPDVARDQLLSPLTSSPGAS